MYLLLYAMSMKPLPRFEALKIGQRFVLASQTWTVSNIENAECVAGQGELPFKVGGGYPVAAVDLRNRENFATLDYSETPPMLFVGQAVDFKVLRMANLRDGMVELTAPVQAQVFRCPSCGAPMQARSKDILAVGCGSCGAVVDTANQNYKLLSKALGKRDEKYEPRLPLGSKGQLDGKPVEVIGFLVKQCKVDGIAYDWREYLLAGEQGSYRWLTEYNGHWNVADVLSNPPATSGTIEVDSVRHAGQLFKHFSTTRRPRSSRSMANSPGASGAARPTGWSITWRRHCCCRGSRRPKDLSWSLGQYVAPAVIAEAFKLPSGRLPEPLGVYANQPNTWEETHRSVCKLFWKLALVAVVLQLFFAFIAGGRDTAPAGTRLLSADGRRNPGDAGVRGARPAEEDHRAQYSRPRQQLDRPRDDAGQQGDRRRLAGGARVILLLRQRRWRKLVGRQPRR